MEEEIGRLQRELQIVCEEREHQRERAESFWHSLKTRVEAAAVLRMQLDELEGIKEVALEFLRRENSVVQAESAWEARAQSGEPWLVLLDAMRTAEKQRAAALLALRIELDVEMW